MLFVNEDLTGNGDIEITRAQNRNYALGEGFHRMVKQSNSWSLALRYQAQSERHYRRAVEEFERLKALRQELPGEPNYDPQPEPNETTCTPRNEPIPTPQTPLADPSGSDPSNCHHAVEEFELKALRQKALNEPILYP